MVIKRVTLKLGNTKHIFEGYFEPDSKNLLIIEKETHAEEIVSRSRGIKEDIRYTGKNPIEFKAKFEEIINEKIELGYSLESDEDFKNAQDIAGFISLDDDGKPPQKIKDLSVFMAKELYKSLKEEGFDVGDYGVGAIQFKRIGDKIITEVNMIVKFCKGKEGKIDK
jgi:hypothetical protein